MLLPALQQYRAASVRFVVCGSCLLVAAWPAAVQAQGGLTATLSVQALVAQPDGRVEPQPAAQVRPGDLLRYQVVYRNTQSSPARGVLATVPIPAGTLYEPAAAERPAPLASIDGQRFEATPLQRQVRLPDGRLQRQPVPLTDYRFLRWPLGDLAPGQSASVSAQARVAATTESSVAASPADAGRAQR